MLSIWLHLAAALRPPSCNSGHCTAGSAMLLYLDHTSSSQIPQTSRLSCTDHFEILAFLWNCPCTAYPGKTPPRFSCRSLNHTMCHRFLCKFLRLVREHTPHLEKSMRMYH